MLKPSKTPKHYLRYQEILVVDHFGLSKLGVVISRKYKGWGELVIKSQMEGAGR